jgi:hypothetical protein
MGTNMSKSRKTNTRKSRLKVLNPKFIVKPSENYMGLSYSDMVIRWQRWLLGDNPDQYSNGNIVFLRGNIGYHDSISSCFRSYVESSQGTAVLVPIITTHYNLGEHYRGNIIETEQSLRKAVREHVDAAGPFWATLEINGSNNVFKLVPSLDVYRVESMLFELNISEKNPFLNKMDEPNYPGKFTALVSGYFVLLRDLPISSYSIRFGGFGMDNFYTDSIYNIKITPKKTRAKDLSGMDFLPSALLRENKDVIKTKIHLS